MNGRVRRRRLLIIAAVLVVVALLVTLAVLLCLATFLIGGAAEEAEAPVEATEPLPTRAPEEPTAPDAPSEPAPQPTQAPEAPTPVASVADAVQAELARLAAGRILYNPPAEMKVGIQERIEVRISMDEAAALESGLRGAGPPQVEPISVSPFMKVRLLGDDEAFAIVPLSSEEQIVPAQGFTEWAWDVTPNRSGERTLSLVVTARVKVAGYADETKDLQIIERQIDVRVNPGASLRSFFTEHQAWIYPTVLVPLLATLGRWLWKRRKGSQKPTG